MLNVRAPSLGCLTAPILLLFAVIFFIIGFVVRQETAQFLERAVRVEGEVIALEETRDDEGKVLYKPVVAFVTHQGERIEAVAGSAANPPAHRIGERVAIYYDPASPEQVKLDSFFELWLFPVVFLVLGALLGVGALFALFSGVIKLLIAGGLASLLLWLARRRS